MEVIPLFDEIDSLRKSLSEALLDAERAREERNREHVRLNAEWMAKCEELRKDMARLDWIARQGPDFCSGIIVDAPGDGRYTVHCMDGVYGEGATFRDAIDAAMAKKEGA
jgi:hypothetical protein